MNDLRFIIPGLTFFLGIFSAYFAMNVWFTIWLVLFGCAILIPILLLTFLPSQDGVAPMCAIMSFFFMFCWNVAHWGLVFSYPFWSNL